MINRNIQTYVCTFTRIRRYKQCSGFVVRVRTLYNLKRLIHQERYYWKVFEGTQACGEQQLGLQTSGVRTHFVVYRP